MDTAALIVAAGMSTRMGKFKPMLSIGAISIAERVIATLAPKYREANLKALHMGAQAAM